MTPKIEGLPHTRLYQEELLALIDARLAGVPDAVELQVERAHLLMEMERFEEAKDIYLGILGKDPTQFVALNNLGTLLNMMGHFEAGLKVYREVVALIPDNMRARLNLAHSLREAGELDEALSHYQSALQLEPNAREAQEGLAYVLRYLGQEDAGEGHRNKAFTGRSPRFVFHHEETNLPRILLLVAPCGGNSPIMRLLEKKTFSTLNIITDFYDSSQTPAHDLVINAIGDADHCGTSLLAAEPILKRTDRPVLNSPSRIWTTGREKNAQLLGALEDVTTQRIISFPRQVLAGSTAVAVLDRHGFTFPILLRSPGFHGGSHFVRVETPPELASAVGRLPGKNHFVIQFVDARDGDGKIRKYRVMMIDGKLYPLHKAVSREWMVHYYSADMAHSAEHRAEDEAFLEDMPGVLGPCALAALGRIRDALGLDYAGADFSLGSSGEILLFEANATMCAPNPDRGEKWDFRRRAVDRIKTAVKEMILGRIRK